MSTSEIEGLSCYEVVQGVVVKSRYVCGLPYLILEAFPELVLDNVVMSMVEKIPDLLLFEASHNFKIKFVNKSSHCIFEKGFLCIYFFDEFA
jgi:hypothetical protein